jgi:hypothetical protein
MRLFILAPVLLATIGRSLPSPPTRVVFVPLIPHIERSFSEQTIAPKFVVFADRFSTIALEHWPAGKSPQLAPIGSVVVCPWSKADGMHGYSVRVQLDSLVGRNAFVRYEISCTKGGSGGYATGEVVQLKLRNGHWSISKVIDRRIT